MTTNTASCSVATSAVLYNSCNISGIPSRQRSVLGLLHTCLVPPDLWGTWSAVPLWYMSISPSIALDSLVLATLECIPLPGDVDGSLLRVLFSNISSAASTLEFPVESNAWTD